MTEQRRKHDGWLGEDGSSIVVLRELRDGEKRVQIEVGNLPIDTCIRISLTTSQALSLLAWLEQEKSTLEQIEAKKRFDCVVERVKAWEDGLTQERLARG